MVFSSNDRLGVFVGGINGEAKIFYYLRTDLFTGQEQSRVGGAGRRNGVLRCQADRLLDALLQAVDSADGVLRGTVRNALFHQLGHAQGKKHEIALSAFLIWKQNDDLESGWVETNLPNIRIFPTDIPLSWYHQAVKMDVRTNVREVGILPPLEKGGWKPISLLALLFFTSGSV